MKPSTKKQIPLENRAMDYARVKTQYLIKEGKLHERVRAMTVVFDAYMAGAGDNERI